MGSTEPMEPMLTQSLAYDMSKSDYGQQTFKSTHYYIIQVINRSGGLSTKFFDRERDSWRVDTAGVIYGNPSNKIPINPTVSDSLGQ